MKNKKVRSETGQPIYEVQQLKIKGLFDVHTNR